MYHVTSCKATYVHAVVIYLVTKSAQLRDGSIVFKGRGQRYAAATWEACGWGGMGGEGSTVVSDLNPTAAASVVVAKIPQTFH